jgi:hypothetical protein
MLEPVMKNPYQSKIKMNVPIKISSVLNSLKVIKTNIEVFTSTVLPIIEWKPEIDRQLQTYISKRSDATYILIAYIRF